MKLASTTNIHASSLSEALVRSSGLHLPEHGSFDKKDHAANMPANASKFTESQTASRSFDIAAHQGHEFLKVDKAIAVTVKFA